jgi:hypothetical protein
LEGRPVGFGEGGSIAEERFDDGGLEGGEGAGPGGIDAFFEGQGFVRFDAGKGNPAISLVVMVRSLAARARYSFSSRLRAVRARESKAARRQRAKKSLILGSSDLTAAAGGGVASPRGRIDLS